MPSIKNVNDPSLPARCLRCGSSETTEIACRACGHTWRSRPYTQCPAEGCSGTLYAHETYRSGEMSITEKRCSDRYCRASVEITSAVTATYLEPVSRKSGARAAIQRLLRLPSSVISGLSLRAPR